MAKGTTCAKVQEFYEKLSRSYDALQTLRENGPIKAFTMTTLTSFLILKLTWCVPMRNGKTGVYHEKWLIRNSITSDPRHSEESSKRERNRYVGKSSGGKPKIPKCVLCKGEHYSVKG